MITRCVQGKKRGRRQGDRKLPGRERGDGKGGRGQGPVPASPGRGVSRAPREGPRAVDQCPLRLAPTAYSGTREHSGICLKKHLGLFVLLHQESPALSSLLSLIHIFHLTNSSSSFKTAITVLPITYVL